MSGTHINRVIIQNFNQYLCPPPRSTTGGDPQRLVNTYIPVEWISILFPKRSSPSVSAMLFLFLSTVKHFPRSNTLILRSPKTRPENRWNVRRPGSICRTWRCPTDRTTSTRTPLTSIYPVYGIPTRRSTGYHVTDRYRWK